MNEPGNLPSRANPCCGHVTDSASNFGRPDELPEVGDIVICLNCGAILVYIDPKQNMTRYARRIEIETLPPEAKHRIGEMQTFIRKRGWLPREARRRDGN